MPLFPRGLAFTCNAPDKEDVIVAVAADILAGEEGARYKAAAHEEEERSHGFPPLAKRAGFVWGMWGSRDCHLTQTILLFPSGLAYRKGENCSHDFSRYPFFLRSFDPAHLLLTEFIDGCLLNDCSLYFHRCIARMAVLQAALVSPSKVCGVPASLLVQ